MITSRHITPAEVGHHQKSYGMREIEREKVQEIKLERKREGKRSQPTERERELGTFSMKFESATYQIIQKTEKCKTKGKVSRIRSEKNVHNHFLSLEFCHVTHLQHLKSLVGQK